MGGPFRSVGGVDGREFATCTSLFMVHDHLRPRSFGKLDAFALAPADVFAVEIAQNGAIVYVGNSCQNVRALGFGQLERHALKDRSAQNGDKCFNG